jgi:HPt (histidine-containing phosphotransfer) domain-containing protein
MHDDVIDPAALRRLLNAIGGDPDDFAELVEDYLTGVPDLVADLHAAAGSMDWERVCRAAHTLKSNATDFGATRLADLCAGLEAAARKGPVESPKAVIAEIEAAEVLARQALLQIAVEDLSDA